jgi:hypothetical protein
MLKTFTAEAGTFIYLSHRNVPGSYHHALKNPENEHLAPPHKETNAQ